ncbi:MAG: hypothetical protein Q9204_006518 [Flavoplaca sp. TL-2023a]
MGVTQEELVIMMETLYWRSAYREICNMLLFFPELEEAARICETHDKVPSNRNFQNMFNVWTGGQGDASKHFSTQVLFDDVVQRATRRTRRLARSLLQSSSFLDIDILYEPAVRSTHVQNQKCLTPFARVFSHRSKLSRVAESEIAPSGRYHLALMFGPIIIESGVPRTRRGVVISPRPCPVLFPSSTATDSLIEGPSNNTTLISPQARLIVYRDKVSHERSVLQESHPAGDRRILCCVKRTYGAAFSGYPTSDSDYEGTILDTFVREAGKCRFQPSKTVPARRRQLHKSATHLCNVVKTAIGNEVKKYIWRIASTLLGPQSDLKWNMFTNNCQRLTDRLLNGKDFEYVFPRLPAGFRSLAGSEEWKHSEWPRYLISFGDRVEGQSINIQQPNSCVTKFCEQIGRQDIIDFLEHKIDQAELESGNGIFKDLKELALVTPQPHTEVYRTTAEDALWDLPRDSLSILQFHLRRPSARYSTTTGQVFDETQWMNGRLRVLQQLDIIACYAGALGLALLEMFRQEPAMVNQVVIPKSRIFGSLRSNEKVRVIRSGGLVSYIISQRQNKSPETPLYSAPTELLAARVLKSVISLKVGLQSFESEFRALSDLDSNSPAGPEELMQINQRENWIYLTVGKILIAHQFSRKSKNTRKAMKKTNWLDILQKTHELRNRWKSQKHNPKSTIQ